MIINSLNCSFECELPPMGHLIYQVSLAVLVPGPAAVPAFLAWFPHLALVRSGEVELTFGKELALCY